MNVDQVNDVAIDEGWGLFECEGSENGPLQLQRIDVDDRYEEDNEAWVHVWQKATEGSAVHRAALDILRIENPQEVEAIEKWIRDER